MTAIPVAPPQSPVEAEPGRAKERVNILLVDDQPGKLLSYEAILNGLDANLLKASSGREALEHLLKVDVAVILVDVCMPDLDGFQLAAMIRDHPRFQKTAIIFISAILLSEISFLAKKLKDSPGFQEFVKASKEGKNTINDHKRSE